MPRAADDPDAPLKRLGGGRWQTRDERFTIEPQSGTWVVVDAAQTDELGLPLVRGPFGSLGAAKAAIADARTGPEPTSTLGAPPTAAATAPTPTPDDASPGRAGRATRARGDEPRSGKRAPARAPAPEPEPAPAPPPPPEPEEPRWLRDLAPEDRRRARRAIERLRAADAPDPEGMVRRDLVGDVPAIAAWAIGRALRASEASGRADLARLLADGRDRELEVRWHLVDGDGRRIQLDPDDLEPDG